MNWQASSLNNLLPSTWVKKEEKPDVQTRTLEDEQKEAMQVNFQESIYNIEEEVSLQSHIESKQDGKGTNLTDNFQPRLSLR